MANHRPKSLSELNNVYDKAMRAERAIKESSSLLSVPETKETPQSENIFKQLETKAAQAEKSQVFDPDITNIANDFLKRYAQAEKPKAAPKEIKRPAPTIQSVYHSAVKSKQEEKQDVPLNMGESPALSFEAPAVPLHKPAPTMPEAQSEPIAETPAEDLQTSVPVAPATAVVTAPQTVITESQPVAADIPADTHEPAKSAVSTPKKPAPRPVHRAPSRVRITSTERNELMEEYMRVMSDDDDDDTYRKPKFSFFKKKKKYEEEFDTEPMADLYEELPEEEEEPAEEIPTVPFDNSDVKYTDEYSDAPAEEESPISQEQMNIYDYIEADFDYDEDEYSDDEEALLDVSFADSTKDSKETEEVVTAEAEEVIEELSEEAEEVSKETPEAEEEESLSAQTTEETEEASEEAEAVVYPEQEKAEVLYEDSPTGDMVFEDIFSVTDESKRSHTGGNWEEVFGENFTANAQVQETEEVPAEDYPEYTDDDSAEEYAQPIEEDQEDIQAEAPYKEKKGSSFLKFFTVFAAVICILGAASTLLISALLDVNSGNLVSERYRVFATSQNLTAAELAANTLVITENIYAHVDDVFVYVNETNGAFEFGKITANVPSLTGDYLYLTKSDSGSKIINRDNSMGVVIATYAGIGGILAAICENYILIAGGLLLLAIAMIVCLILISRRKVREEYSSDDYESTDDSDSDETHSDVSGTDTDESEEDSEDDGEYYSDFDTDGIEQGLFNSI